MSVFSKTEAGSSAKTPKHYVARKRYSDIWPLIKRLYREERRDIIVVFIYGIVASVLGLVVPLSSQAIVNAVALGVHSEQLVVLCIVVLIAMLAMAIILIFQKHVIDYMQRRQFLVTAREMVDRLPRVQDGVYEDVYAPELANRFFDVVTVQKAISKFLTDGVSAMLSIVTGFIVLAIYHPLFLIYDIVFLLFIPVLVFVFGRRAIYTAVNESSMKYKTLEWIEEVSRSHRGIKMRNAYDYATTRVDKLAMDYADAKEIHFRIYARQIMGSYIFRSFATVGILALGGNLVIEQQISLGQLVAAEIIIVLMMSAMDKLLTLFDVYYEFAAALTKIESVNDLPLEEDGPAKLSAASGLKGITVHNVNISNDGSHSSELGITLALDISKPIAIVGPKPLELTHLGKLISGLKHPSSGRVEIFGEHSAVLNVESLHNVVAYLDRDDVIHQGTIYDNIVMGRKVDSNRIDEVLKSTLLESEIRALPKAIYTATDTLGRNLPHSLRLRILIARALLVEPKVLIINNVIDLLEPTIRHHLVGSLHKLSATSIVHITTDPIVISACEHVVVVSDGSLQCQGSPSEVERASQFVQAVMKSRLS